MCFGYGGKANMVPMEKLCNGLDFGRFCAPGAFGNENRCPETNVDGEYQFLPLRHVAH